MTETTTPVCKATQGAPCLVQYGVPEADAISAVPAWGVEWTCSFGAAGQLREVRLNGRWYDAEDALGAPLRNAIAAAYAEMPA